MGGAAVGVRESRTVTLNELLEDARQTFTSPSLKIRKEALERIWDALERLKTIEAGKDNKATVAALLAKAIPDQDMRDRINKEMADLTEIGKHAHDPPHRGRQEANH